MRSLRNSVREIGADLKLMTSTAEKITQIGFTNSDQDAETANNEIKPADSEREMERLLLAASGAIQRLFGERRALRDRVEAQEKELTRLRAHVSLIHDSYRRLTSEFVTQFRLMEDTVDSFVQPFEQAARDNQCEKDCIADG
jgi:predicted RNase H-like nuclease (RuvC/YqgF family)